MVVIDVATELDDDGELMVSLGYGKHYLDPEDVKELIAKLEAVNL